MAMPPRWKWALTRKRLRPVTVSEKSNFAVEIQELLALAVGSSGKEQAPRRCRRDVGLGRHQPWMRKIGGEPTTRWMSLALCAGDAQGASACRPGPPRGAPRPRPRLPGHAPSPPPRGGTRPGWAYAAPVSKVMVSSELDERPVECARRRPVRGHPRRPLVDPLVADDFLIGGIGDHHLDRNHATPPRRRAARALRDHALEAGERVAAHLLAHIARGSTRGCAGGIWAASVVRRRSTGWPVRGGGDGDVHRLGVASPP